MVVGSAFVCLSPPPMSASLSPLDLSFRRSLRWLLLALALAVAGCDRSLQVVVRGLVTKDGVKQTEELKAAGLAPVCYVVLVDHPSATEEYRDASFKDVSEEIARKLVVESIEAKGYRVSERAAECDWFVIAFRGQTNASMEFTDLFEEVEMGADDEEDGGMPMVMTIEPRIGPDELRALMLMGLPDLANARSAEAKAQLYEVLGEDRWYVGVLAYDIQALVRGEKKLVWATFVHARAGDSLYAESLATLMATASAHLGENTRGLRQQSVRLREGRVEVGELEVIGAETTPATP